MSWKIREANAFFLSTMLPGGRVARLELRLKESEKVTGIDSRLVRSSELSNLGVDGYKSGWSAERSAERSCD